MKTHLGDWNPFLEGWHVCTYDDCTSECIACVELPPWYKPQNPLQAHYTLTYLTARALLDYRIASVLHLITLQYPPAHPGPQTLAELVREAKIQARIPPRLEPGEYAWEYTLWRGIAHAHDIAHSNHPVIVKAPQAHRALQKLDPTKHAPRPQALSPDILLVPRPLLPQILQTLTQHTPPSLIQVIDPHAPPPPTGKEEVKTHAPPHPH